LTRSFNRELFASVVSTFQMQGAIMFGIGTWELVIVGFIVLILFGSRLPGVMRSLGQGVVEFKKGVQGIDDDKQTAKQEPAEPEKAEKS
jgi:sec-independent protein translocase protein TatA